MYYTDQSVLHIRTHVKTKLTGQCNFFIALLQKTCMMVDEYFEGF